MPTKFFKDKRVLISIFSVIAFLYASNVVASSYEEELSDVSPSDYSPTVSHSLEEDKPVEEEKPVKSTKDMEPFLEERDHLFEDLKKAHAKDDVSLYTFLIIQKSLGYINNGIYKPIDSMVKRISQKKDRLQEQLDSQRITFLLDLLGLNIKSNIRESLKDISEFDPDVVKGIIRESNTLNEDQREAYDSFNPDDYTFLHLFSLLGHVTSDDILISNLQGIRRSSISAVRFFQNRKKDIYLHLDTLIFLLESFRNTEFAIASTVYKNFSFEWPREDGEKEGDCDIIRIENLDYNSSKVLLERFTKDTFEPFRQSSDAGLVDLLTALKGQLETVMAVDDDNRSIKQLNKLKKDYNKSISFKKYNYHVKQILKNHNPQSPKKNGITSISSKYPTQYLMFLDELKPFHHCVETYFLSLDFLSERIDGKPRKKNDQYYVRYRELLTWNKEKNMSFSSGLHYIFTDSEINRLGEDYTWLRGKKTKWHKDSQEFENTFMEMIVYKSSYNTLRERFFSTFSETIPEEISVDIFKEFLQTCRYLYKDMSKIDGFTFSIRDNFPEILRSLKKGCQENFYRVHETGLFRPQGDVL